MPMSVEKNSVHDHDETEAIMDFLNQFFSEEEIKIKDSIKALAADPTASPSEILSKLNERKDLSKAKNAFQQASINRQDDSTSEFQNVMSDTHLQFQNLCGRSHILKAGIAF